MRVRVRVAVLSVCFGLSSLSLLPSLPRNVPFISGHVRDAAQVDNLHLVPDNLSDKEACFVEPLAAANRILEQKVPLCPSQHFLSSEKRLVLVMWRRLTLGAPCRHNPTTMPRQWQRDPASAGSCARRHTVTPISVKSGRKAMVKKYQLIPIRATCSELLSMLVAGKQEALNKIAFFPHRPSPQGQTWQ